MTTTELIRDLHGCTLTQALDLTSKRVGVEGQSLSPVLPLLFRLAGKPYDLTWSHFLFEPMFRIVKMPRRMIYLTGRQTAKSTSMAASQILRTLVRSNYNVLTVMPLYEQVRKFSTNYVRPFIVTSPLRHRLMCDAGSDSVLQRQIGTPEHNSALFYSYSHGDPNRVRGIPASETDFDEIADLDIADLPIIESCMGASPHKVVRYTGTPKTLDNTAYCVWEESSQARWHIPCICGKLNRSAVDADLLAMIGDGSKRPDGTIRTLICAKCGRDLNSRSGYFLHDLPDRQISFAGYHVPQIVLPMHYEVASNWFVILETMNDKPAYVFHNEVLGEAYDAGSKLITQNQLREACIAPACSPAQIKPSQYIAITTGVDWGGRGKEMTSDSEDFISNTAFAVGGMRSDGVIEIKWLHKVPYAVDMSQEPELAVQAAAYSHSEWLALDYGGQGNVQEQLIQAHGWPANRIVPFTYSNMSPTKPIVFFSKSAAQGVRSSYTLDKTRSLLLLCELIKRKLVLLPDDEKYFNNHLRDFLAIYEESMDSPSGSKRRIVKRIKRRTDDVVHAINFVVMSLYHTTGAWPALAQAFMENPITIAV